MRNSALQWLGRSLVVSAVAILAACGNDAATAPKTPAADLGNCQNLQVPAGSTLSYHAFAKGVQIYRWSGTAWVFVEPSAVLFGDANASDAVGIHYAGPTWGVSGSKVVGSVVDRCTPNASAIPWLLLSATADGPGVFQQTTHIQRVKTTGGNAPASPGTVVGELTSVPYSAEYFFYRR